MFKNELEIINNKGN